MNGMLSGSLVLLVLVAGAAAAGGEAAPCSRDWYRVVEQKLVSGDGQGHGPAPGSNEWKSVVEFKLGIRGQPGIPDRDSDAWCHYIDGLLREL